MKIYELRIRIGKTNLLYQRTFTSAEAARKRFARILEANGNEIKTAKLATLAPDSEGSYNLVDVVSL